MGIRSCPTYTGRSWGGGDRIREAIGIVMTVGVVMTVVGCECRWGGSILRNC